MTINNWRKFDETSFNLWTRGQRGITDALTKTVDNIYNATNNTSNTYKDSVNNWNWWVPWETFTLKTPRGRLVTGVQVWKDGDVWTHFLFTDVKLWGNPIMITASNKTDNEKNIKALAHKYTFGTYWDDENIVDKTLDKLYPPDIMQDDKTSLDDLLDKKYEARKKELLTELNNFKKARPDERWALIPKVSKLIVEYNSLTK